tara:strand:+ start:85 stop:429 length:345 start_codon:yes stop_codon:yes gene_type:complete
MQDIYPKWREYLSEIKNRWEFSVLVRLEKDANLYADLFEKIRAIPGVTIVKTAEKQKNISPTQKAAVLDIKCIVSNTGMANYRLFLRDKLSKLKDEEGDRILGVRFTSYPKDIS